MLTRHVTLVSVESTVNEWVKRKRALIQDSIRGLTNPEVAEREA